MPTTRYNFLGRGNYELNDWIGVFGTGMFSHNDAHHTRSRASRSVSGWGISGAVGQRASYIGNAAIPSSVIRDGDTYMGSGVRRADGGCPTDNPTQPGVHHPLRRHAGAAR